MIFDGILDAILGVIAGRSRRGTYLVVALLVGASVLSVALLLLLVLL